MQGERKEGRVLFRVDKREFKDRTLYRRFNFADDAARRWEWVAGDFLSNKTEALPLQGSARKGGRRKDEFTSYTVKIHFRGTGNTLNFTVIVVVKKKRNLRWEFGVKDWRRCCGVEKRVRLVHEKRNLDYTAFVWFEGDLGNLQRIFCERWTEEV